MNLIDQRMGREHERRREWERKGLLLAPDAPTIDDAGGDVDRLRKMFGEYYGTRQTSVTSTKLYRLFRSGGVKPFDGESMSEYQVENCVLSSPYFDHAEVWSRDSHPCIIVGHPYPGGISPRSDDPILNDLSVFRLSDKCKLDVFNFDCDHSHYGSGTLQYLIFAHGFLASMAERRG